MHTREHWHRCRLFYDGTLWHSSRRACVRVCVHACVGIFYMVCVYLCKLHGVIFRHRSGWRKAMYPSCTRSTSGTTQTSRSTRHRWNRTCPNMCRDTYSYTNLHTSLYTCLCTCLYTCLSTCLYTCYAHVYTHVYAHEINEQIGLAAQPG